MWAIIGWENLLKTSLSIPSNTGSTRFQNAVTNPPLHLKSHYCCQFLKQIYNNKYIFNIDECGFGWSTKGSYSWLPKGKSLVIINDVFKGRANLIFGISQFGDYIGMLSNKTIASEDYCLYFLIIARALKEWTKNIENGVVVIQD